MARRSRLAGLGLGACGLAIAAAAGAVRAAEEPPHPASLDAAIVRAAARHGIPESLVRRIVMRESKYNASAHHRAYWGLMQISYPTARSMGFHGSPEELLNPVVNLRYAVPYLANAFVIAGRRQEEAVRLYAAGYYYTARTRGLIGALRTADSAPLSGVPDEPEMVASAGPPAAAPEPGLGIFGGLFGPNEMPRDASTQQAVYSAATPQLATAPPSGTKDGVEVAMVADKHGDLRPPRSWQRDGGTSVMARGEQAVEQVAAAKGAEASDAGGRHRHARKSTVFASLEAPTAAQAYAAAPGQDSRLMQADSQAAISQATAGQPQAVAQTPPPGADQAASNAATARPEQVAEDEGAKKSRRKHARRSRHRDAAPEMAVAQARPSDAGQPPVLSSDQQAAVAPEQQPAAPLQQTAEAAPQGAPQQDAGAAAQAQFEQMSGGASDAAEPARRHKRHARRSHGHTSTDVAAQAPSDGQPQPAQ